MQIQELRAFCRLNALRASASSGLFEVEANSRWILHSSIHFWPTKVAQLDFWLNNNKLCKFVELFFPWAQIERDSKCICLYWLFRTCAQMSSRGSRLAEELPLASIRVGLLVASLKYWNELCLNVCLFVVTNIYLVQRTCNEGCNVTLRQAIGACCLLTRRQCQWALHSSANVAL